MGIASAYKRWRHGRGYGVHSPLAYDLVMNTLQEHCAYYCYDRLDNAAADSTISPRRLRLIFRLLVRFNPHSVAITGDDRRALLRLAAKSANSHCRLVDSIDEAEFVIVNDNKDSVFRSTDSAKVYLFLSKKNGLSELADSLWSKLDKGLRLDNHRDISLIIASPSLPHQQIDVRF